MRFNVLALGISKPLQQRMKQAAAEVAPDRGDHQVLIIPALPDIMRSPT
jgi:hypothetical protein